MKPAIADLIRQGKDPFGLPELHLTRQAHESMAINRIRSGAVIMAGSGMCTGGRVRHHLRHNLAHSDCSVIFVGYAAEGTLARIIIDGARNVTLFGEEVPVRAKIHTINGFSAHAGQSDLREWHRRVGARETTFLVHGEQRATDAFGRLIGGSTVRMPKLHESYEI